MTMRKLKICFDEDVLQSVQSHSDWQQIWFRPTQKVKTVADLLSELWDMMGVDQAPNVKVSSDGFFVPVRSDVDIISDESMVCIHNPGKRLAPVGALLQASRSVLPSHCKIQASSVRQGFAGCLSRSTLGVAPHPKSSAQVEPSFEGTSRLTITETCMCMIDTSGRRCAMQSHRMPRWLPSIRA